jgi:DNA-binding transcriptional LysR family regulator
VSPESVRFDLPPICAAALSIPDLQLDLRVAETIEAASGVRDGRFELAVVDGPSPPIGLSDHVLVERNMELVVGSGHPWWDRHEDVGIDELLATSIWLPQRGTGSRDVIEEAVNLSGASTGLRAAGVGDSDLRLAQAVLGRGAAVIRSDWIDGAERSDDDPARSGLLRRVPTSLRLVQPIRLVWKGRQPGSAAAFTFWHQLRTSAPEFERR